MRGLCDTTDVLGNFARTLRGIGSMARHFRGGRGLFLDGHSDDRGDIANAGDDLRDFSNGVDCNAGVRLNGGDAVTDILSSFSGLLGQLLDFIGDHGKALACFSGACGLNGGVQGQEIGLLSDGSDDFDDLADFGAGIAEPGDDVIGFGGGGECLAGDFGGFRGALGDVVDARVHLFIAVATDCRLRLTSLVGNTVSGFLFQNGSVR